MSGMLFGEPDEPKPQRLQSAKDRDDAANKVVWRRYKGPSIQCQDCVAERANRAGIGRVTWIRKLGDEERALCYHHRGEYLHREALDARRGG